MNKKTINNKVRNLPGSSYNSSESGSSSGAGGASMSLMEKRKLARKKKSRKSSSISTAKALSSPTFDVIEVILFYSASRRTIQP